MESSDSAAKAKSPYLSWVTISFMTVSAVASIRAAPSMAVYGLAAIFLLVVPAIVFLLPTSLISAAFMVYFIVVFSVAQARILKTGREKRRRLTSTCSPGGRRTRPATTR